MNSMSLILSPAFSKALKHKLDISLQISDSGRGTAVLHEDFEMIL